MSEFVYFRDTQTGKVVYAPEAWANLFGTLVEIPEDEATCVDCWPSPQEPEVDYDRVPDVTFDNPIRVESREEDSFSEGDLTDTYEPEDDNHGE